MKSIFLKSFSQLLIGILYHVQLIAFFTLSFIIFYIGSSFSWAVFSERDISRAGAWLEGHFYWLGPEMTGGNSLPGPFFYFLLFPAFLMGGNTYSQVALWTIIWFALTYTVAFFFISKIVSHKESLLIFLITFTLNTQTTNYSVLLNPEFAVMFHVLSLIGLYYWREKRNNLYLYLTGIVIALGIQIHLLMVLHIITVILFYIMDKSKNIKILLWFLLLSLNPVLIYSVLEYFHVFNTSGRYYDEYTHRVLKNIFSEKWFYNIKQIIVPFILFIFYLILTLWRKQEIKKWTLNPSTKNLLIITAIPFLITLLGAHHYWYLLFVPVFSIIFISKWFDDLLPQEADKKIFFLLSYILFTVVYFMILNYEHVSSLDLKWPEDKLLYTFFFTFFIIIVTSLQWQKKSFYRTLLLCFCVFIFAQIGVLKIFSKNNRPVVKKSFSINWLTYKELYPLMKRIYLETSWSPKTAMEKIFNIGIHPERSLLVDYTMTVENLNEPTSCFSCNKQDIGLKQDYLEQKKHLQKKKQGYFVIQHLQKFIGWTQKDWKNYLSHSSLLSNFLSHEIKENGIIIQKPKLYILFWLIPYNTTKNSLFPNGFHNIGQPYYWENPEWLRKCNQTQKFKNEKGLFYCKVFTGYLQRAGINIKISKDSYKTDPIFFLNIQFFGSLLGMPDLDVNLDGGLLWSDIQMYLDCNKKLFHWIFPSIGYLQKDEHNPEKQAKTFLAPLKLRIPLKECKKDEIQKIRLTFIEKHSRYYKLKTESIVWELN